MSTGHTALPWSAHAMSSKEQPMNVVGSDGREWQAMQLYFGHGEKVVGQIEMRTVLAGYPLPVTEEETRANLALILRAVNSHDELLATLQDLQKFFQLFSYKSADAHRLQKQIDTAIAKATGSAA